MTLQSLAPMLEHASDNNYAVPQFNVDTIEIAQGILFAAAEAQAPVILAIGQGVDRAGRMEALAASIRELAQSAPCPVCLHLDHSEQLSQIGRALRAGFTGLMIDASALPLAENIAATQAVLNFCADADVGVEAELGRIAGVEDDLVVSADDAAKVDIETVGRFLDLVRPHALAVAVGTAHGFYDALPQIDLELISKIRQISPPPLVLHGGTGLSGEVLSECVRAGFSKVNFASELRRDFLDAICAARDDGAGIFEALKQAQAAIQALAHRKFEALQTGGRAPRLI